MWRHPVRHVVPAMLPPRRCTTCCRRQRAADPGDHPPVCGGARQVLWQRVRAGPHLQLPQGGCWAPGGALPLQQRAHAPCSLCSAACAALQAQALPLPAPAPRPPRPQAYFILDELLLAGELQETSKKAVTRVIEAQVGAAGLQRRPWTHAACPWAQRQRAARGLLCPAPQHAWRACQALSPCLHPPSA